MTTLSPRGACRHSIEVVYLSDYGYDSEGRIMEEISARECSYIYLTGDFSLAAYLRRSSWWLSRSDADSAYGWPR